MMIDFSWEIGLYFAVVADNVLDLKTRIGEFT